MWEAEAILMLSASGHGYVPRHLLSQRQPESEGLEAPDALTHPLTPRVTPREREVLARLAEGGSNKAIAKELGVSVSTVKTHIHSILTKLNVASRGQAAARYSDLFRQET